MPAKEQPDDASEDPYAQLNRDVEAGQSANHPIRQWLRGLRERVTQAHPWVLVAYRVLVGVLGGVIVVIGLILVPLPGPGWLIVFLGLAVLGTEFRFARRISHWLRAQLARFWAWWKKQRAQRRASQPRNP